MENSITPRSVCTGDQFVRLRLVPSAELSATQRAAARRAGRAAARPARRVATIETALQRLLAAHSVTVLRVCLGAVFLGFGALKFFPGVSPAQDLAVATTTILTFGLVPAPAALVAIACLESVIGLWLLSGRALRGVICLLAIELVGIMSPAVVLAARLFSGPHHAPTLEGQYVLKDVILVGAVLVVAAAVLRAPGDARDERAAS